MRRDALPRSGLAHRHLTDCYSLRTAHIYTRSRHLTTAASLSDEKWLYHAYAFSNASNEQHKVLSFFLLFLFQLCNLIEFVIFDINECSTDFTLALFLICLNMDLLIFVLSFFLTF